MQNNSIDEILKKRGWTRMDSQAQDGRLYTLMWSELKCSIDFQTFREGDIIVVIIFVNY